MQQDNGDAVWLIVGILAVFIIGGLLIQYVLWAGRRRLPSGVVRRLRAHPGAKLPIRVRPPAHRMRSVGVTWDPSKPRGDGMYLRMTGYGHYWIDADDQVHLEFTPDPPSSGGVATMHRVGAIPDWLDDSAQSLRRLALVGLVQPVAGIVGALIGLLVASGSVGQRAVGAVIGGIAGFLIVYVAILTITIVIGARGHR